jgi:CheY-like chemotaxis protein
MAPAGRNIARAVTSASWIDCAAQWFLNPNTRASEGGAVTRHSSYLAILIVDENTHFCRMLSRIFEALGYRVQVANKGVDARAVLALGGVDLLITEIALVGESGLQLAAYAETLGVPALLLSSNPERQRELAAKRVAFVDKSVLFGTLADYLRRTQRAATPD